jgi:hypothetical protein
VLPAAASRSAAYAAVRDLLRRPDAPTALLSATDRAAGEEFAAPWELIVRESG